MERMTRRVLATRRMRYKIGIKWVVKLTKDWTEMRRTQCRRGEEPGK